MATSPAPDTESYETIPVTSTRQPLPKIVDSSEQLVSAVDALARGEGPIAVDAERAGSFIYTNDAQLIQLRREGAGTFLIDPVALKDTPAGMRPLSEVMNDEMWILHAADQDLPCLAELGLVPAQLGDTLLAGRLLGYQRCNLGHLTAMVLGYQLAKNHGHENWSRRPLPDSWLNYAALDVEFLNELWSALEAEAEAQGRLEWITQECEHIRTYSPSLDESERWRRTSKIHTISTRRDLEIVRQLWKVRDEVARDSNLAAFRVLSDRSMLKLAEKKPRSRRQMRAILGRDMPRTSSLWTDAITRGLETPKSDLPSFIGPTKNDHAYWQRQHPEAASIYASMKKLVSDIALEHTIEGSDLVHSSVLRELAGAVSCGESPTSVRDFLNSHDVRPWQCDLIASALSDVVNTAS